MAPRSLIALVRRVSPAVYRAYRLRSPLLLLVFLAAACSPTVATAPVCWRCPVEEMTALTGNLQTPPEHLLQPDAVKTGEEFDVSAYFEVLDGLSMEQGYVLDYVYWYDDMGAHPVLYARRAAEPPFENHSAYVAARGKEAPLAYLEHVQVDGTAGGFYQLVVLRLMGEQFYLWWHATMNDTAIITSRTSLQAHQQVVEGNCTEPFDPVLEAASQLALEPGVRFENDLVVVNIHTSSSYSGVQRTTFSIRRDFPHTLVKESTETLIEYFCGEVP